MTTINTAVPPLWMVSVSYQWPTLNLAAWRLYGVCPSYSLLAVANCMRYVYLSRTCSVQTRLSLVPPSTLKSFLTTYTEAIQGKRIQYDVSEWSIWQLIHHLYAGFSVGCVNLTLGILRAKSGQQAPSLTTSRPVYVINVFFGRPYASGLWTIIIDGGTYESNDNVLVNNN
jgi:hypothetical protein